MAPQNPLTRLRQVALDLQQFADALEDDTHLDVRAFRYWHRELLDVAVALERMQPPRDASDGPAARPIA